jgi:hypothetical protein
LGFWVVHTAFHNRRNPLQHDRFRPS